MDPANWFGLTNGKIFGEAPAYVDTTLAAGMTEMPKPTVVSWLRKSPFILITSPNFVWAVMSLGVYFGAPYDLTPSSLAAQAPFSSEFLQNRLSIWLPLVLGYFSFWHVSLYKFQLASRPFIQSRMYNLQKLFHNVFWTTSGIFIWALFENLFCHLWATGRLNYVSDSISFTTPVGFLKFVLVLMGIPVWRSIHFYFAHRFLHYGPLYQQVHSLHHRNTDIEPFSGLCMHPVEHLYYYACMAPSLVFYCSPFAFVWNGVHLLLSPAASHSGYEDHFQSDVFHYLHHRYFECNYAGSDAAFMDIFFGTFKGSFLEHLVDKDGPKAREDAKSTLIAVPTREFVLYLSGSAGCVVPWAYVALNSLHISSLQGVAISSLVGFGPVLLATLFSWLLNSGRGVSPVKMTLAGNLLHLFFGTLFCSVPITVACWLALEK
jgi:sterol desaturase/sphingolipid hydroxylase (fatty acid hydroxylase superfamily)